VGTTIFSRGDTHCLRWGPCAEGTEVQLCVVEGGGHSWPGGFPVPWLGETTNDLDATSAMLDFFEAHPIR
jgi:polyhydroxybutyrate depolymerase